jgi:dolichol-phosphate mannosyltransferase
LKTTIILPTYNEGENLPRLVPALLDLQVPELSLLIIDDNSPDGTGKIADELAANNPRCISVRHRTEKLGLGSAYIMGFNTALDQGAEFIGQMDSDFSHPPDIIPELVSALQEYDIALGSRYVNGGAVDENWPLWRKGLSAFGNSYARKILNLTVNDVTGGLKFFRRASLKKLPLDRVKSNGYVFQIEINYLADRLGLRTCEIPIYFADRKWGKSKMSLSIQVEAALRVWYLLYAYRDLIPGD